MHINFDVSTETSSLYTSGVKNHDKIEILFCVFYRRDIESVIDPEMFVSLAYIPLLKHLYIGSKALCFLVWKGYK